MPTARRAVRTFFVGQVVTFAVCDELNDGPVGQR
jgi:hypothetical protein